MIKKVFGLLVLALAAFLLGLFCVRFLSPDLPFKKQASTQKQNIPSFQTKNILPQTISSTQQYIGYVVPIHQVSVMPFISGFVEKVLVSGGQAVKKDDVLVVLQQDEYEASLDSASANIAKAYADYQNKESYFKRLQKASSSVSASELEQAKAAYLSAKAQLKEAEAAYHLAEVNYNYTLIRSPIDGIVGDVSLTKGNYISPASEPLFSIVQYNPIRVVFSISDTEYLEQIKKNKPFEDQKLTLELPNGEQFAHQGHFSYMDNQINKSTSSMSVYADFENVGKILTPNTYVNVLCTKNFQNALLISKDIVDLEQDGSFVYVIRNGIIIKTPIQILASKDNGFIVQNNFEKDDKIIVEQIQSSYLNQKAISKENI